MVERATEILEEQDVDYELSMVAHATFLKVHRPSSLSCLIREVSQRAAAGTETPLCILSSSCKIVLATATNKIGVAIYPGSGVRILMTDVRVGSAHTDVSIEGETHQSLRLALLLYRIRELCVCVPLQ